MAKVVRPLHQPLDGLLDRRLGLGVDARRGLVEDQDPRVLEDGARDRDALALAAGETLAALADEGVVASGRRRMKSWALAARAARMISSREPPACRRRCSPQWCRGTGTAPAGPRRSGGAGCRSSRRGCRGRRSQLPAVHVVEPAQQVDGRALARAAGTDQADHLTRLDREAHVLTGPDSSGL